MSGSRGKQPQRKQILAVDHSPELRELVRIFFEEEGYTVATTSLDTEPVEQVAARQPDLFLLNAKPGNPEDLELLEILSKRQAPPVVVLSTDPELLAYIQQHPERYMAQQLLCVPADVDRLSEVVHALIGPP